jgi:hypothetical protein
MGQKVPAREIRNHEAAQRAREGTENLEQCPGCPAGGMFRSDPHNPLIDGCSAHSSATFYATSRDSGLGGGNLFD